MTGVDILNIFDVGDRFAGDFLANFCPRFGDFVIAKVSLNVVFVERIEKPIAVLVSACVIKIISKRHVDARTIYARWRRVAHDMPVRERRFNFFVTVNSRRLLPNLAHLRPSITFFMRAKHKLTR